MKTEIWIPGTNNYLDKLFEDLRKIQNSDTSHPLHKNYDIQSFKECSALSITFLNHQPVVAGSILQRNCWPTGAFRVLNRFWKIKEHRLSNLNRSNGLDIFCSTVESHVIYAEKHLGAKLVFMSRQSDKWQKFIKAIINKKVKLSFSYDNFSYLTCENQHDQSCWQKIIYKGNEDLLQNWQRK